jgi:predicted N-acyltransferase
VIVEPLSDAKEWEDFVANSSKGSFFHTLKWKKVLEESFPFESLYLVIRDSNDKLIGVCPFFITKKLWPFRVLDSLPNSDLGGPLMKEEYKKEAANILKDYFKELSSDKGVTYAKMRLSDRELCEYLKTKTSRVDTNSGTMILDLKEKPVDFIWNEVFKQKQRKYIKRFEHDGFKTKEVESEDDLKKFYVLYLKSMNQKDSLPYPFTFYKNEFDLLYPNNFNIIFIENEERCIGAGIVFIYEP